MSKLNTALEKKSADLQVQLKRIIANVLTDDMAKAIGQEIGYPVNDRSDTRRIVRANDLFVRDLVKPNGSPFHWEVQSQTRPDIIHHVFDGGGCTCEDWQRANKNTPDHYPVVLHRCKHMLSVDIYKAAELAQVARLEHQAEALQ